MKKILLIGKTGQLGSAILKDAAFFGHEVLAPPRSDLDITSSESLRMALEKVKPDILINTAAYNLVGKCEEALLDCVAVNFVAVADAAMLCKKYGVRFITYSTDYVFDGENGKPNKEIDYPRPLQNYGISKLAGELAAMNIYPEGAYIIRICGLYGKRWEGSREKGGNCVLNILKEAKAKKTIEVSSEQIVSPTFADDVSVATLKLLDIKAPAGIYHLVNEGYCSWYDFVKEIFKVTSINCVPVPKDRAGFSGGVQRPKFSALLNTKAKALGVTLPHWRDGLKRYLESLYG